MLWGAAPVKREVSAVLEPLLFISQYSSATSSVRAPHWAPGYRDELDRLGPCSRGVERVAVWTEAL